MTRTTIDYGIDLGTTNSAIAVLDGTGAEVIQNKIGALITPSAVWVDKKGTVHVGQEGKQRAYSHEKDTASEFKLKMGKGEKKLFESAGREMLPFECSAEVLKELKKDVRQKKGEDIQAAVITVPASFEIDQIDATRKAAELAGFTVSPLLQEPVAAALAYGFQSSSDNVFWLVYDFGGGTFDAAVVQVRDGIIQVVNHEGNNCLGGQRIDWNIVEKKLIPALTAQYSLTDFRRGNEDWRQAVAKLKNKAEEAKIEICRTRQPANIWIEDLCKDDDGEMIDFEFQLSPEDIQEVIAPLVKQSISLSRQAIENGGLTPKDIQKVLLVGGTSLTPWVQEALKNEFDIELDLSIDPMTVVAQGAAVFAGTQKLEQVQVNVPLGTCQVRLEYDPIGSDTEPPVGGRVVHPKNESLDGYTIELVETKSQWRSGKIALSPDGVFMTSLYAEKGRKCEYQIELCDPSGTIVQTAPDKFGYTVGAVITAPPLTHHIGVAMPNNEPDIFFEKGTPLPARMTRPHRAAYAVHKGVKTEKIRIPIVEGENLKRADRNDLIGVLEISAEKLSRDIPAGADIEITISIDKARIITTKAYVPILDEEFEAVINYQKEKEDLVKLRESFKREKKRLQQAQDKTENIDSLKAEEALSKIEEEEIVENVESLLSACDGDTGAIPEFQNQLVDLRIAIDEVEDAVEWPILVEEARETREKTKNMVNDHGTSEEKELFRKLESANSTQSAIDSGDVDVLKHHVDELYSLHSQILVRQPGFWVGYLEYLEEQKSSMRDAGQAAQLISQGRRAINNNDIEALKAAVRQLIGLLPKEMQQEASGYGGTTIR